MAGLHEPTVPPALLAATVVLQRRPHLFFEANLRMFSGCWYIKHLPRQRLLLNNGRILHASGDLVLNIQLITEN